MTVHLAVSITEAETIEALQGGPRRDFLELAKATGGTIHYRRVRPAKRGLLGRMLRPGFGQAWEVAGRTAAEDTVFADQELLGLSLLGALALRRRRPRSVVVLAHLPGRWWKRAAFWTATRLGIAGRLIVHSAAQADRLRTALPATWGLKLHPYQVDTAYWQSQRSPDAEPPLICAVGSEHRDYDALARAAEGLPVRVVIAAGSNWARRTATVVSTPPNVTYIPRMLSYTELRALYDRAAAVVVPLVDVPNQSGITTVLEAMSMARPVIVTATRGQREAVSGPLVRADGRLDAVATRDRGPAVIAPEAASREPQVNGLYVPPDEPGALRAAIQWLIDDPEEARALGAAGREDAERYFSIERFAERFAESLVAPRRPATTSSVEALR